MRNGVALARAFVSMAVSYWLEVFPSVRAELARWREHADAIPDDDLRHDAVASLITKSGNVEGAAAFAALAPRAHRPDLVRLLVAFQAMHDYLDTVSEAPADDQLANGRQLHSALQVALEPAAKHMDYYRQHRHREDGGYLRAYVEACQREVGTLPSYGVAADATRRAAYLSGEAQSRLHGEVAGDDTPRARWAATLTTGDIWLTGWEVAAAACSTLTIYALLSAAAGPLTDADVRAIERAYFPWITGVSTLLDSLADHSDDLATGSYSHVARYESNQVATARLTDLIREAIDRSRSLPFAHGHTVLVSGMIGYYLSTPLPEDAPLRDVAAQLVQTAMPFRVPVVAVFRLRALVARLRYPVSLLNLHA